MRPWVGVGVVVLRNGSVLLIRRAVAPALGCWSLPGGAQELGETAEDAARRELFEETGVQVSDLHLVAHVDSIHRDERGIVQYHYTILDFAAHWRSGEPIASTDVSETLFVDVEKLSSYGLTTDIIKIIDAAWRLLQH